MGETIEDMLKQGDLLADPKQEYKPSELVDLNGKPIVVGTQDPDAIGPDSSVSFSPRSPGDYPHLPPSVIGAEAQYVLPLAQYLANAIGVTPLDDRMYKRVTSEIRSRSLFVVLNMYKASAENGYATWFGLVIMCRNHPLVMVQFKQRLSDRTVGIPQVRLWSRARNMYIIMGDQTERTLISREEASSTILNYLRDEGVVYV